MRARSPSQRLPPRRAVRRRLRGSTRGSSARASSTRARGHARLRPAWYGERILALGRAPRGARSRSPGPIAPGPARRPRPGARRDATSCPMLKETGKVVNERTTNWTIGPCPTPAWAELVHPDLEPDAALERSSSEQLVHVLRLDEDDPVAAWRARADTLVGVGRAPHRARASTRCTTTGPGTDLHRRPAAERRAGRPRASRRSTASCTCRTSRPRRSSRRPTRSAPTAT